MIRVPLAPVPNQTLSIVLAGQLAQIAVRQNGGHMYFDLKRDDVPIVTCRICRDRQRLLLDAGYRGFIGEFAFADTQGFTDPRFDGLDTRYLLVYLEAGE